MKKGIRIIIADNNTLFREILRHLIKDNPDIEVVGDTATGRDAMELCKKLQPDILLLELDLPDIDGFEVINQLVSFEPCVKMLVLTEHDNEKYAIRLIKSGAKGYLNKQCSYDELLEAIIAVSSDLLYLSPSLKERITSRLLQPGGEDPVSLLSDRELQVVTRLSRCETLTEIADELGLSPHTIETYKSRAMKKLGLKNLGELVRFAIQNNLIK
ncbi:response regulator transcription factor [bacterium]|nr:response regulator transcription factor [bacterium]